MTPPTLQEGMKAPSFRAPATDGREIALEDLRGKTVILYFYPKDNTPGCTKQACSFRDANSDMAALGAIVLGVSKDSLTSHDRFQEKHHLNFPLLSDPEGRITTAYGAWKEKSLFGKTAMGVERCTFLIDGEGIIRKIWRNVKVDGHAEEVLEALKQL